MNNKGNTMAQWKTLTNSFYRYMVNTIVVRKVCNHTYSTSEYYDYNYKAGRLVGRQK